MRVGAIMISYIILSGQCLEKEITIHTHTFHSLFKLRADHQTEKKKGEKKSIKSDTHHASKSSSTFIRAGERMYVSIIATSVARH